ncbi:MAG: DUF116 domain-containing protein [Desulfuromonadaceae bacterium]|nr:DUF116 domain-containing protein [Desulfuromonadaceae bacterium]
MFPSLFAKEPKAGKSLLPLLLVAVLVVLPVLAYLAWYLPSVGLIHIHPLLPWLAGLIIGGTVLFFCFGLTLLLLTLVTGKDLLLTDSLRRFIIKYLLPGILGLGQLLRLDPERLQNAFISLNNQLVRAAMKPLAAREVMILLPHCLQRSDCPVKITGNLNQCLRCGRCAIMELIDLARAKGVELAVVTGGTLARKVISQRRPKLIVAVACERDLVSGIRDAWPLPVIALINERPEGPCVNTRVDVAQVARILEEQIATGIP